MNAQGPFSGAAEKPGCRAAHRAAARLSPRTSHRGAATPLTHPIGLPSLVQS